MEIKNYRFDRHELAGSLGDIGVLFPLAALLISKNGMNPTLVFSFVGLLYLITGIYFRVPVPVQPLKAVAVIAIASNLSPVQISTSGLEIGILLLILVFIGGMKFLSKIFIPPIIRGIQLGIGLLLLYSGLKMVIQPWSAFSLGLGIFGILMILGLSYNRHIPAALALIVSGFLFALFTNNFDGFSLSLLGPQDVTPVVPSWYDFYSAFILLVIPQLPLTLGNSIFASTQAAQHYFNDAAERVSEKSFSISLGAANIIIGIFGGMPVCHGSGGFTSHYKFGARTGGATIIIGSLLLFLALVCGKLIILFFNYFPLPLLGSMLIIIGYEHSKLVKSVADSRESLFIALVVGILSFVTKNMMIACVVGLGIHYVLILIKFVEQDMLKKK